MSKLGDRLKELREAKSLSLRDMQQELGIDRSDLSKYERGRFVPTPDRLHKLAQFYDLPYRELRKLYIMDLFTDPDDYELVLEWAAEVLNQR